MIVHFFAENKFISFVVNQFVAISFENCRYFLINKAGCQEYIYDKNKLVEKVTYDSFSDVNLNWSIVRSGMVHYLNEELAGVVCNSPAHVRWCWSIFGGDVYPHVFSDKKMLKNNIELEIMMYKLFEKNPFKRFVYRFFYSEKKYRDHFDLSRLQSDAIGRFNYFSTVIPPEADYLKKHFPSLQAQYLNFTYGNIKSLTANLGSMKAGAKDILVGNSGDPCNRHDVVIDILNNIDIGDRKVICPLSYGYNKYIEYILMYGKKKLKRNFMPLTDFMPLEEYISKLSDCSVCIMNHHRQQGLGNIIAMLWLGAKVFLNEDSLAYSFFKGLNMNVFSIQNDLLLNTSWVFDPLTDSQIESNRRILSLEYSEEKISNETKALIDILTV